MSRPYDDTDRIIAIAGIFQSAGSVRDIANKGLCNAQAEQASINSLFAFDAPTAIAVFGELANLRYGLQTLYNQLEEPQERDLEVAQYVVSLVHLADKMQKDTRRMNAIGESLQILKSNQGSLDLSDSEMHQRLSEIYQQHISVLQPKILVKGKPLYLENAENAARVRSLLLAGFRAAILWRQCKGKKIQLLFSRSKIAKVTKKLLQQT